MQQNHNFIGSENTSQATRTTQEIAKNRSSSLSNEAAYDSRTQNASWSSPGSSLEKFGSLPGLSWEHLGRSWAAFGRSWASLGRLFDASWAGLVASGLSWRAPGSILRGSGRLQGGFSSLRACIFRGFCMRARLAPSAPYLRPELAYVVTAMPLGPAAETLSTAFFTACSLPGVLPWMFFTLLQVAVFESFRRVP